MSLFAELRRRNVFRVGAAYLVLAWLVIQITDTVAPALKLPEWILGVVVWIGIIGFPFALFFSWAFELTPEGIKREEQVERDASITSVTGRRIDRVIVGLLAVIVGFLLVDRYYLDGRAEAVTQSTPTVPDPVSAQSYTSIAVLPFVNMSNDEEQAYFSDGISEELLNLLASIDGLKVAARTSSFAFRGKEQDIREIGATLNVETVLEGSVPKAGNRIRVTAQLISAADGYHLWSDNFDRELTDIFQIQDDISDAIVEALRVHLDPGHRRASVARTASLEAYDLYLQGRHQTRSAERGSTERALELFRQATKVDPNYAPAWAASALAVIYLRESPFWDGLPADEVIELAQGYIERALELDPNLAEAYVAQSALHWDRYLFEEALASIERALSLNSSLAVAHLERAAALSSIGRIAEARGALLIAADLDPLDMTILLRAINLARNYRDLVLLDDVERRLRRQSLEGDEELLQIVDLIRVGLREQNLASIYRSYSQAEAAAEEGSSLRGRLEFMRLMHGSLLYHQPESWIEQGRHPPMLRFFTAVSWDGNEAAAWARYEEMPEALRELPVVMEELSILQMRQGDCVAGLATLERAHSGNVPIYGQVPPSVPRSNANLAANRVFCLRQLGKTDEAEAILARLRPFVDNLKNSAPGGYELLAIKLEIIDGRADAALQLLESAVKRRHLGYPVWGDPIVKSLETQPEYAELRQWLDNTINAERAELGWPAVQAPN
jgi:TolB-like protein